MDTLVREGLARLAGKNSSGVFHLKQTMGGGKTHLLVGLGLLAKHPDLRERVAGHVPHADGFGTVRIAAFNGRNSPENYFWGVIADALGNPAAFRKFWESGPRAPGEDDWLDLFAGDTPVLILLDEMPPYFEGYGAVSVGTGTVATILTRAFANMLSAAGKKHNVCVVVSDLAASYEAGGPDDPEGPGRRPPGGRPPGAVDHPGGPGGQRDLRHPPQAPLQGAPGRRGGERGGRGLRAVPGRGEEGPRGQPLGRGRGVFDQLLVPFQRRGREPELRATPLSQSRDQSKPFSGEAQVAAVLTADPIKLYEDVEGNLDALRAQAETHLFPVNGDDARWADMRDRLADRCGMPWMPPGGLETLRTLTLQRDKWEDLGGERYSKNPKPKKASVQVVQLSEPDAEGRVQLRVETQNAGPNPKIFYVEDGKVEEATARELRDDVLYTQAVKVQFLVKDPTGVYEAAEPKRG